MNCQICKKPYTGLCDYNQGRCPNHPPLITMNIQPRDPSRGHFYVSTVKSAFRIVAAGSLIVGSLLIAGILLMIAEFLGIAEELV